MHQFVQSAIEAAKQGDNAKALAFLKQVLNANPNDVDAWLVLAAVVDDPQRKRQCLKRVLTLDPVNMVAREELEDMDRAEMGYPADTFGLTQDGSAPVSTASYEPEKSSSYYSYDPSAFEPEPVKQAPPPTKAPPQTPAPRKSPKKQGNEKPQVFQYSLVWRVFMYIATALFGAIGLLMLFSREFSVGMSFIGISALFLIVIMFVLPTVEMTSTGIRTSGLFSSGEAKWDEIVKMKSNTMKSRMELTKRNKQMVYVSSQVSGYSQIVETLRQKRPDLFGMAPRPQAQVSASTNDGASYDNGARAATWSAPAFKGTRNFRKSFFMQYGILIFIIPLCLFAVSAGAAPSADNKTFLGGMLVALICIYQFFATFFQTNSVKIAGNKLTIGSLFTEKSFSAKEIRDIRLQAVRRRYGSVVNYVNITTANGKNYSVQGFTDGEEAIYGSLTNWWEAYRNA